MNDLHARLHRSHLVTPDGTTLSRVRLDPPVPSLGTAFVAHGQAHHAESMRPTLEGLATIGWTVHAADLRGHGNSSGARAPLGHMEVDGGWNRLVDDLRLALRTAFEGVPHERRLVVAPNLGAVVLLDVLKDWPDLAPRIVLVAPPSNQLALTRLARGFVRARLLVRPAEAPDEMTLHQLYTFLGAQLHGSGRLLDVVSGDPEVTGALEVDPLAWPVPTTGYFYEFFRGIERAWTWPDQARVAPDTRVLVLYGSEDGVTSKGRFVAPMRKQLLAIGFQSMDVRRVEGGRAGLILDERRLGIARIIGDWAAGSAPDMRGRPEILGGEADGVPEEDAGADVLERLGLDDVDRDLNPDELVELCYNAVDDERRWVELLYRIAYAAGDDSRLGEDELQSILAVLMPHWERSFRLNRQIMQAAAIGAVLENVIDRFRIGIAVVTADLEVLQSNAAFREALARLKGDKGADDDVPSRLRELVDETFRARIAQGNGEAVLMVDGEAVGFHFRPVALRQTALQRGGAAGVLVLRSNAPGKGVTAEADAATNSSELLQLAYGLTAAEAAAAIGILNGQSPAAIAERLGVTIHTTRTHLRRIYEKVGVQGQTEFAARLLGGPLGLVLDR